MARLTKRNTERGAVPTRERGLPRPQTITVYRSQIRIPASRSPILRATRQSPPPIVTLNPRGVTSALPPFKKGITCRMEVARDTGISLTRQTQQRKLLCLYSVKCGRAGPLTPSFPRKFCV
ncbi:hypothetical protein EVAR_100033_1 [Eumeta japonica]|uniref:Uncharacterized protein n=1 Tax=Eumeta variegata TaxID=151549 RepID=A0A4C1ZRW4_EUMVA|nr:hypothetical protein EVAR_100033_1 [Eumeta japonica]